MGHAIDIKDFSPPDGVIAAISWCPVEVPHEPAGLIYECGGKVIWVRKHAKEYLIEDEGLDKSEPKC